MNLARAIPHQRTALQAETRLPTRHGSFRCCVFDVGDGKEHVAMVTGEVHGQRDVLVRMHSECLTSEVLGSLRCDCAEQLEHALAAVSAAGRGVVLYLRQEGRGIGLTQKVRAYALQERGLDTVDANRALGLPDDARDYECAARMLRELGVESVRLVTNNPAKEAALQALGIEVTGVVPTLVPATVHSHAYLSAKRTRMAHRLPR